MVFPSKQTNSQFDGKSKLRTEDDAAWPLLAGGWQACEAQSCVNDYSTHHSESRSGLVRAAGQGLFVFPLIRFYFIPAARQFRAQRRDAARVNRIRRREAILSRTRVPANMVMLSRTQSVFSRNASSSLLSFLYFFFFFFFSFFARLCSANRVSRRCFSTVLRKTVAVNSV